ncbi:MAG: hypothetical protein MI974_20920 [Chitinophagales bacterium]|nr:hypothetical protein [Chitinophagales bacterium]
MKKVIKSVFLPLLVGVTLLTIPAFQKISDGILRQQLSNNCIDQNITSPMDIFQGYSSVDELFNCLEKHMDNYWSLVHWSASRKYKVESPEGNLLDTWYNDKVRNTPFGNSNWVKWLAIYFHELKLLQVEASGLLVLSGEINGVHSAWALKFTGNGEQKPLETTFIDLYAGSEATKAFLDYLERGNNYANSRVPDFLRNWSKNPNAGKLTIRAILDEDCQFNQDVEEQDQESSNLNAEEIENLLRPIDKARNQPQCITDALQANRQNFFILTEHKGGASYMIWNPIKTHVPETMPKWYLNPQNESLRGAPWITWYAMITRISCKEVANLNGKGIVLACPGNIQCFRSTDANVYDPLGFLNPEKQRKFCQSVTRASYPNHIIRQFVEAWFNGSDEDEMKIIAYFNPASFEERVASGLSVTEALDADDHINDSDILVERKIGGKKKYTIWSKGKKHDLSPNLSAIFLNFKNEYFARLLIARHKELNVIGLDEEKKILTFVVTQPRADLFAWRFSESEADPPKEYKPLKDLYGNQQQLSAIIEASVENISTTNNPFRQVIRDYFLNGKELKIRQLFPRHYRLNTTQGYSPLNAFGNPGEQDNLPPMLKDALANKEALVFLIEDNGHLKLSEEQQHIDEDLEKIVLRYENPWLAWLCLADPQIVLVADAEKENALRFCLVSGQEARVHLWRLVVYPDMAGPPQQKKLLAAHQQFELTGQPLRDYIFNLPGQISSAEQQFYLFDYGTKPFVPLDFVETEERTPSRIIIFRKPESVQPELFRIGDGFNAEQAIPVELVGYKEPDSKKWEQLKRQYQVQWIRDIFKGELYYSTEENLKAWVGKNRIGLSKNELAGVFLAPEYRNFNYYRLKDIQNLVAADYHIFKPHRKPSEADLFNSWVASDWDTKYWRANPLGYFDRVQPVNL